MGERENILNRVRTFKSHGGHIAEKQLDKLSENVRNGIVTLEELAAVGMIPKEIQYIQHKLDEERCLRDEDNRKDEVAWTIVQSNLEKDSLNKYLEDFPEGRHVEECRKLLSDLPWLNAMKNNTIRDYEDYIQDYPGKHDDEALQAIANLKDDNDWNNACITATTNAYQVYISQHPCGKHVNEANNRIQSNAGKDQFLADLKSDPNVYSAQEIQKKVNNNVATWNDIEFVLGSDKTKAIRDFIKPSDLPTSTPPSSLKGDSTEVYFWGTPGSGKTCALGSIISGAKSKGIFEPQSCAGYDYMTRLSNLFSTDGVCMFPGSTSLNNIQEMKMCLRDGKDRNHKLTLVDLAGELFNSVYELHANKKELSQEKKDLLDTALGYLKDTRNNKIHFFVVEYGAHNKEFTIEKKPVYMRDYLATMIQYLKDNNIFRTTTVGIYVLVTKCDRIDCERQDRGERAYNYVKTEFTSMWNTLTKTKTGVRDVKVISYSVGDVFAKNLCIFDSRDTDKVIDKLLTKTRAEGGGWDRLLNWLNW